MMTSEDVTTDFVRIRADLIEQAQFFEVGLGRSPSLSIETVKRWIAEYDALIAEFS